MKAEELLNQFRDVATVRRVFGEPFERDGVTIIPVARVMGGVGGGQGRRMRRRDAEQQTEAAAPAEGTAAAEGEEPNGLGMGMVAVPAGVYVIDGGVVTWKPAVDVNRFLAMALAVTGVGLVSFFVFRGRRRETHVHLWNRRDGERLARQAQKAARQSAVAGLAPAMAGLAPVAVTRGSKLLERMPDLAERGLDLLERLPERLDVEKAPKVASKLAPKAEAAVARAAELAAERAAELGEHLPDLAARIPDSPIHLPHADVASAATGRSRSNGKS